MPYQVCTHCVLDTSEPLISFDINGVCNYCNEYFAKNLRTKEMSHAQNSERLRYFLERIKAEGKNKDYDCLIGLSGGVDSSYVAYLVKNFGLRPLAVHLDNGWDSELAVMNIENVCNKLEIDLFTHVINWEEFKDLQLSFLKASVRNAEAPTDHAIYAILHHIAKKYKLKWIIDGVNDATEFKREKMAGGGYAYSDLKQITGIHKIFGKVPLKTFPKMSYLQKLWLRHVVGVNQFSILNYVDYNKNAAIELLKLKLGWKSYGEKHHESLFTKWHQTVYLIQKFGYDKRKLHLSDLILSGQITREEAAQKISSLPLQIHEKNILEAYVQKKLGLTQEDYNKILNESPRDYTLYPNDEWVINLYFKIKSIIKLLD